MSYLSNNNEGVLNYLKHSLEAKAQLKVMNSYDCLQLKSKVEHHSNKNVSFSSYRRLFGLVKLGSNLSKSTLDILAALCGFDNLEELTAVYNDRKIEKRSQLLINHLLENKHKTLLGNSVIEINNWEDVNMLYTVILQAIYIKDYDLLFHIFDKIPVLHTDEPTDHLLEFITQPISIACYKGDEELIQFIGTNISESNLIDCIVRQSVFEDKLNGYYGDWIVDASKLDKYSDDLFISLMLLQRNFINNEIDKCIELFYQIEHLHFNSLMEQHPILAARFAAWEVILLSKSSAAFNLWIENYSPQKRMIFMIFFSRLIWEYSNNISSSLFDWFDYIPDIIDKTFADQGRKSCFWTHYCYYQLLNNKRIAQLVFDRINPQLFYPSNYNFYCKIYSEIQGYVNN